MSRSAAGQRSPCPCPAASGGRGSRECCRCCRRCRRRDRVDAPLIRHGLGRRHGGSCRRRCTPHAARRTAGGPRLGPARPAAASRAPRPPALFAYASAPCAAPCALRALLSSPGALPVGASPRLRKRPRVVAASSRLLLGVSARPGPGAAHVARLWGRGVLPAVLCRWPCCRLPHVLRPVLRPVLRGPVAHAHLRLLPPHPCVPPTSRRAAGALQ